MTSIKKKFTFEGTFFHEDNLYQVRSVVESDIEELRCWKNEHRQFFHYKEIITPEQQIHWFHAFTQDPNINIFMCENKGDKIGCVGFRRLNLNEFELFNLICGNKKFLNKGITKKFLQFCLECLLHQKASKISLEVLKNNFLAVEWYIKQGFEIIQTIDNHHIMNKNLFKHYNNHSKNSQFNLDSLPV